MIVVSDTAQAQLEFESRRTTGKVLLCPESAARETYGAWSVFNPIRRRSSVNKRVINSPKIARNIPADVGACHKG